MIGVEEKERIRRAYFIEHRSIRWIARNYHFSRTTVRKALADASSPMYKRKKKPVSRVLEPFNPTIKEWLEEDKTEPKKQRHTGKRIFDRLKGLAIIFLHTNLYFRLFHWGILYEQKCCKGSKK